jgi:Rab-GTPase-TBC domain
VSLHESVGYCQGMNFVVGILLNVYADEEKAFWACLGLFKKCKLNGLYRAGLPSLHIMNYQLQRLLESIIPKLYKHLRSVGMSIDYFTSKWIMTLFGCFLSFELLLPAIDNVIIVTFINRMGG